MLELEYHYFATLGELIGIKHEWVLTSKKEQKQDILGPLIKECNAPCRTAKGIIAVANEAFGSCSPLRRIQGAEGNVELHQECATSKLQPARNAVNQPLEFFQM